MRIKQGFLGVIVVLMIIAMSPNRVEAAVAVELPLKQAAYDYKSDPFLLEWTFATPKNEEAVTEPALSETEMKEEKMLARWKEKQARLWQNLPKGEFTVNASAYTAAADECGKSDGITASGLKVTEKRTLACPPNLPFGTKVKIAGMGEFRCEDRGGAIKGNKIDIYMETKAEAFAFGRRNLTAEVIQ